MARFPFVCRLNEEFGDESSMPFFTIFVAAIAVGLGAATALGLFGRTVPSVPAPLPLPLFVFGLCGLPPVVLACLAAAALLAWQPGLLRFEESSPVAPMPIRTWVLLALVLLFSLVGFVCGWKYGVQYQGIDYARQCAVISTGLATVSVVLSAVAARTKEFFVNVLAHATLFYWIATYAFPYLGESL